MSYAKVCIKVDSFYYGFEGNQPEKPFLLACKTYFPSSKIIGFQHTTFFPNGLTYQLAPGESKFHLLPDKIICSGPMYMELFTKAKFPKRILANGPNLRFEDIHIKSNIIPQ